MPASVDREPLGVGWDSLLPLGKVTKLAKFRERFAKFSRNSPKDFVNSAESFRLINHRNLTKILGKFREIVIPGSSHGHYLSIGVEIIKIGSKL